MNLADLTKPVVLLWLALTMIGASTIIEIEKPKDLKKTISSKTSLLVLFASSNANSEVSSVKSLLRSVDGSFASVDCSSRELKKLCKKSLPEGNTYTLKHYKDGAFNKDYDRQMTKTSLQTFMRDPTGEIPYEEEPSAKDVVHLLDTAVSDVSPL